MTLQDFMENYVGNLNDFAYYDDKFDIGIYPESTEKIICCSGADDEGTLFTSYDNALDKFMVNGRPFRDTLPDINENLL
ncbi:hypothetical protein [Selenomonas sp. F0473]|jgi:hypothetical protein|uniref:hypothetical protein n=1 Tax=Selenomonas sp. F0473 TaxID=999423 RepID=UPI00029E3466|nr:hypothetical protein [Selenomonas sp. F0473]EKU72015.1 hypothetical protein HMPREF9161_00700 [Selenomonas sp. F0473]